MRLGLLSTARINDSLLRGAAASERVEVVAVASRSRQRAEAYARERAIPRAYGSYEELLAAPDVDAVYVPLPNSLHAEWALRALEAGKHVLCEKSFSPRPEDVERCFAAAEQRGLALTEGFMWRHLPQTGRLQALLRERRPGGGVERIEVEHADAYRLELEDLADAIEDGRSPLLGREDALGQARVLEALLDSAAAA